LALKDVPRILVGVLGYTGSGKSSLINALIDHELLLPCNAMRASTSVVVEVAYNRSDDPNSAYCAEIDFVTKEEWTKELEVLQGHIQDRPEGEPLDGKSGSEASAAFAKITAVYPDIDIEKISTTTPEEFLQIQDLSETLGKSRKIHEAKVKPFYSKINAFIDSKNSAKSAGQIAFWPLVKVVKIYVKAPVLQNGLVLVDLPGLGDSNDGRANVAKSYIRNLQHIWVVADIARLESC
jgi:GTPase SAR1 family protein